MADVRRANFVQQRFHFERAMLTSPELSPVQRIVGWTLLQHHNRGIGASWPSVARLAFETGFSERSVQEAIKGLVQRAWFAARPAPGAPTRYVANFDRPQPTLPFDRPLPDGRAQGRFGGASDSTPPGANDSTPPGANDSREGVESFAPEPPYRTSEEARARDGDYGSAGASAPDGGKKLGNGTGHADGPEPGLCGLCDGEAWVKRDGRMAPCPQRHRRSEHYVPFGLVTRE